MMIQQTLEQLHALRLRGMAAALEEQMAQPGLVQDLGFNERLAFLVQRELTEREDRRLQRLLQEARFRISAAVEDIDFRAARGLDRSLIARLGSADWVRQHQVVLIVGPTGAGKTYLACALGQAACRHSLSVRYYRPALSRTRALACGRLLCKAPAETRAYRAPHPGRLGNRTSRRSGAARSPRSPRGPLRPSRHHRDQPTPHRALARLHWQSHAARCDSRSPRPQRPQADSEGRLDALEAATAA